MKAANDTITTVGDLMEALDKYDPETPIRMWFRRGSLENVSNLRTLAGRVVLEPRRYRVG